MRYLTNLEKKIISMSGLNAEISAKDVAKKIGCSPATVRNTMRLLQVRGVIQPRNYIDVFKLGLSSYVMLFSFDTRISASLREGILKFIIELPGVVWVAEVSGVYEYIINFCLGDIYKLTHLIDKVGDKFCNVFSKKIVSQHLSYRDYSYSLLPDEYPLDIDYVGSGTDQCTPPYILQTHDHDILKLTSISPLSQRQISKDLGIPSSTVQYHCEQLKEKGVWKRTIYVLDYSKIGFYACIFLLYANTSSKLFREAIHAFSFNHRQVTTLTETVGLWDFEISCFSETMGGLQRISSELIERYGDNLKEIQSLSFNRLLKWDQYPFDTFDEYRNSVS